MELMYPWVLAIGVILVLFLVVFKIKKENQYKTGNKVANTQYVRKIPYYQKVLNKYKKIVFALKIICILSIIISIVLLAGPSKTEITKEQKHSRDIMICMDTSMSVNQLNLQLIDKLKSIVEKLDGERVGITIFNTTPVLLVPLTDDYDYVNETLDTLYKAIEVEENNDFSNESLYLSHYIMDGTLIDNETRGSSLIGDGLASCVYNFSKLDEERTRIIIFSTDNNLAGTPWVTLEEATQLAKENDITIFAIAPEETSDELKGKMKKAVEKANGKFYEGTSKSTVKSIVENIEKESKSLIEAKTEMRTIGKPEITFMVLIILITVLFILIKKVKI